MSEARVDQNESADPSRRNAIAWDRTATKYAADVDTDVVTDAEKIDGKMDDIFALQDRIVTSLTELLRIQLSPLLPPTSRILLCPARFSRSRQAGASYRVSVEV